LIILIIWSLCLKIIRRNLNNYFFNLKIETVIKNIINDLTMGSATSNNKQLQQFCKDGNYTNVVSIINNEHITVNINANNGKALQLACKNGHFKLVEYLVENGANVHANINQALCIASNNDYFEIIIYLLEQGANIHTNNDYVLRMACKNTQIKLIEYLVENGANVHANNDYIFNWACEKKQFKLVKFLVEHGVNASKYYNDLYYSFTTQEFNTIKQLKQQYDTKTLQLLSKNIEPSAPSVEADLPPCYNDLEKTN